MPIKRLLFRKVARILCMWRSGRSFIILLGREIPLSSCTLERSLIMKRFLNACSLLGLMLAPAALAQSGSTVLIIDGTTIGAIGTVNGGNISADVVNESPKGTAFVKKHLGPTQYEPFELSCGLSLDKSFYELIDSSFANSLGAVRFNGSVAALDANQKIKQQRDFKNALITEVTFPALDAASKESGLLTVKFKPTGIQTVPSSGSIPLNPGIKSKAWLVSNFRLTMDGLDTNRVTRIESFGLKRILGTPTIAGPSGTPVDRDSRIEVANLHVTLPQAFAKSWQQWLDDFVVAGNNNDSQEKSGSIALLTSDLKTEIGRVNLAQCGIYRLADTKAANGIALPGFVTVDLYCEQMVFDLAK